MASLCLKKLLDQAIKNKANDITRSLSSFLVQPLQRATLSPGWKVKAHVETGLVWVPTEGFCTHGDAEEKVERKKTNPNAKITIGSVGRKIPHRIVHLIDENGEDQGTMHRADVIRIMDEREMKLVLLKDKADPPVYKLMTGHQIHEERLKLRDKQKASSKNEPVQQKELTFSTAIGKHDLDTKIKQIQQWIDKKHHVRIMVQQRNVAVGPEKMLAFFDQIVDAMPEKATYLSQPRVIKEGRSTCVLRHMSDREIRESKKKDKEIQKDNGIQSEPDGLKQ